MLGVNLSFLETETTWVKFGIIKDVCFVGREAVAFGSGCYVDFIDITTKHRSVYTANNNETGDGVKCINGHKIHNIFAFAEMGLRARIFVLTYPEFRQLAILDPSEDGLLWLSFSETNYLTALDDLPYFGMTIWNWKTGEKIAFTTTDILCKQQIIRSSYGSPLIIAQMGVEAPNLTVWEVLFCGKRCLMAPHKIKPVAAYQKFVSVQFTSENALFVQDVGGDIYTVTADYKLELVIEWERTGSHQSSMTWFKGGLLGIGPDGTLRHFKKAGAWSCDYEIDVDVPLIRLMTNTKDQLVVVNEFHDFLVYEPRTNHFHALRERESHFDDLCVVYPLGELLVTMAWHQELTVWEVRTARCVDSTTLGGPALSLAENPEYPYFAVGFGYGMVQLFGISEERKLKLLTSFHLTRNSISKVAFVESGLLLVAADMSIGEFFIIEGRPGSKMHVIATCNAHRQIADFFLVASERVFRLFTLNVTSNEFLAGNQLTRFCIVRGRKHYEVKHFDMGTDLYSRIYANKSQFRDRVFYAQSTRAKSLYELDIKRGEEFARIIRKISSKHQMRKIVYYFTNLFNISYGYDGLILMLGKEFEYKWSVMVHHRLEGGIEKAFVDPYGKYIVALGRNNTLACLNIIDAKIDPELVRKLKQTLEDDKVVNMLTHPTIGFLPKGDLAGKTWLEVEEFKLYNIELRQCDKQKKSVLKKFQSIRTAIKNLLTANLKGPENEHLDIQEFNLDEELKAQLEEENVKKCEETKIYLEALIVAQDKVSDWIKSYCWDPMATQGRTIFGIFSAIDVENYTLLPDDLQLEELVKWINKYREIEKLMSTGDIFEPWKPILKEDLKEFLNKVPCFSKQEEDDIVLDDLSGEELSQDEEAYPSKETQTALMGSTAHNFVELSPGHYEQCHVKTFYQTEYQSTLSQSEQIKLMKYFNKEFDALMSIKERDMNQLAEWNERLRVIVSELNFFSEKQSFIIIDDPTWEQREIPEQILKVTDQELSVKPYVSPSQQAILEAEEAERERIRLLLLADDFKERALMAMMNGVLEVRWEDELKKEVKVPKCMLEKDPEEFREDDIKAVAEYQRQCEFLESERLRYRRMLCAEYSQLGTTVREGIKKFNSRLEELLLLKVKVDSAIDQECLLIHRMRLKNYRKMQRNDAERALLNRIRENESIMEELHKTSAALPESVTEVRNLLEQIQAKDKLMEKNFKRDIIQASGIAQEIALKLYKRRPRTNVRGIMSPGVLHELSRCVVTKEKSVLLNAEALDFLKAMDNLDLYIGIPNAVDEHLYHVVCRHRRLKIEMEIKIKAITADIAEADATVSLYHKQVAVKKDLAHKLAAELAQVRQEKIRAAEDMSLQVVLKQGYVELAQTGRLSDFEGAVMVTRTAIEEINKTILDSGAKKLKAMKDAMVFHRQILMTEWCHKKMKMEITDLMDYMKDIEKVNVTKEVQAYLRAKARGESPEKGTTFEQEVDVVKHSYQKIIDERRLSVADLRRKIGATRRSTRAIDRQISDLNVDVCEHVLQVDQDVIDKEKQLVKEKTDTLIRRAKLVQRIQENHNQILVLQTELELLRLKTYPTLKYKIVS